MNCIHHLFHINAPQQKVFEAISKVNGYKSWWVEKVSGGTKIGEEILFSFGDNKDLIFKVEDINPLKSINFKCLKGHPE